jgi:hypothetical protein
MSALQHHWSLLRLQPVVVPLDLKQSKEVTKRN